ncbi:MAG: helix-turn-helix transcriptional regulator [Proteobacteria bacterium]|nr:helix-turn-helix transcriptional regulator [Pseudomonadota bacterium]
MCMINTRVILYRLKKAREERGLRQDEMARCLDIDRTTYLRKEKGQIPISTEEWLVISEVLDKDPTHFFIDSDLTLDESPTELQEHLIAKLYRALDEDDRRDFLFTIRLILKGVENKEVSETLDNLIKS